MACELNDQRTAWHWIGASGEPDNLRHCARQCNHIIDTNGDVVTCEQLNRASCESVAVEDGWEPQTCGPCLQNFVDPTRAQNLIGNGQCYNYCTRGLHVNNAPISQQFAGTWGDVCELTCNVGFEPHGTHICSLDGTFAGGTCVPQQCQNFEDSSNFPSHARTTCLSLDTNLGQRCAAHCENGYYPTYDARNEYVCQAHNGGAIWARGSLTCFDCAENEELDLQDAQLNKCRCKRNYYNTSNSRVICVIADYSAAGISTDPAMDPAQSCNLCKFLTCIDCETSPRTKIRPGFSLTVATFEDPGAVALHIMKCPSAGSKD
eukprot:SAG11_NODE_8296_length_1033_cov_0.879015_1_plen_318_part_10